jgi:hypothetical protein
MNAMKLEILPRIGPNDAALALSEKRGIYFWFTNDTDTLVYIGVALGSGGLKKRILSQHLNSSYLEFRPQKQSEKDKFQLQHAVRRMSKDGKTQRYGIDKSAFRKSIGRKKNLKPGEETVQYIMHNLYLKVFESEDISAIKDMEISLIKKHEPLFNTSHNSRYT